GRPITAGPCKVCYDAENGHYYQYVSEPAIAWHEAEAQAAAAKYRGLPGYLATITSTEEFNFINNVVFSAVNFPSGIPANVYVGGSDSSAYGTSRWVTGPERVGNSAGDRYTPFGRGSVLRPVLSVIAQRPCDRQLRRRQRNRAHPVSKY